VPVAHFATPVPDCQVEKSELAEHAQVFQLSSLHVSQQPPSAT